MSSIAYLSALELASKIRDKQISSVEITQHYIDRIEKYDDSINAVVVRTFEDALEKAAAADAALGAAKRGPGQSLGRLHGVPMTIKESYVMANTPTTWGIEGFRHNVAKSDGLTAQRFRGKQTSPSNLQTFRVITLFTAPPVTPLIPQKHQEGHQVAAPPHWPQALPG
jgi:Asp-tRNA(Asn)/Glu-tRNA(Gln) amidotransferase A subunit family amidase